MLSLARAYVSHVDVCEDLLDTSCICYTSICEQGGFQAEMTKREAALILGLRESAAVDKVKDAHRKIMIANHPDSGGSSFIATKVNEAKEMMLGKGKRRTNVF